MNGDTAESLCEENLLTPCPHCACSTYAGGQTKPRRHRWTRQLKCGTVIIDRKGQSLRLLCDFHSSCLLWPFFAPPVRSCIPLLRRCHTREV
jgi:hypothetical protein